LRMLLKDIELTEGQRRDIKRCMHDYLHTKDEEYAMKELISLALAVYRYKSCKDLLDAGTKRLERIKNGV
jgi:hypothetical protein